jgi:CMP-N-acetylneuraminic acid synthetase
MIRLEFLKALGGYNESFTCQDGYDLWIKFISHHKVANINEPLFSYRRHNNNLTNNEHKILSTRKKIKETYVRENLKTPNTIAIIPVRDTIIGDVNWPLFKINGKTIIQNKIDECLKSEKLNYILVSVASEVVYEHIKDLYNHEPKLIILERPKSLAALNVSLSQTIFNSLEFLHKKGFDTEAVMTISLEYPFLTYDVIDEMINTLVIFKSDAVLSVRPDNRSYYQHTGHSLKPILDQEKYTRLEREALYRGAGGLVLSTVKNLKKNGRLLSGSISHVVVDEFCTIEVNSKSSLEIFKLISEKNLAAI